MVQAKVEVRLSEEITSTWGKQEQNMVCPTEYNFDNPIVGISWQSVEWWLAMQFIFADGSRTNALDSGLDSSKWQDEVFPSDCPLTRI